jgi:hypothetical protein
MLTAALLSVGIAILYFAFIEIRHHGHLAGPKALSDDSTLMGVYFAAFAAILIGAEAGTIDLANGVFRDLVATGRSRTALFLVRVPVAIAVTLTLSGFAVTVAAAYAFHGSSLAPSSGLALKFAAWVALATVVQATLAVGIASLTGSRSITLVAVIGSAGRHRRLSTGSRCPSRSQSCSATTSSGSRCDRFVGFDVLGPDRGPAP